MTSVIIRSTGEPGAIEEEPEVVVNKESRLSPTKQVIASAVERASSEVNVPVKRRLSKYIVSTTKRFGIFLDSVERSLPYKMALPEQFRLQGQRVL